MTYRPWAGRKFGVELEMNTTTTTGSYITESILRDAVQRGLTAAGSGTLNGARASYYNSNGRTWDVKTDSSAGWEVAAPALVLDETANNAELKAVCENIAALHPSVNRQCGLHVHVDVSDFTWTDLKALIILWSKYEPFFFSLQPASRRHNTYCEPMRKSEWTNGDSGRWSRIAAAIEGRGRRNFEATMQTLGKYSSLNLGHFWRRGTIEFRLGAGTVQYEKIRRWVQLLLSAVQRSKGAGKSELRAREVNPNAAVPRIRATGTWTDRVISVDRMMATLGLAECKGWLSAADIADESRDLARWAKARQRSFARAAAEEVAA